MIIRYLKHKAKIPDVILEGLDRYLEENLPQSLMADEIELSAAPVCQSAPPEAPFPQMMPTYGAGQIRDESVACYAPPPDSSKLDDILDDVDDTFQESLLKIIDEKGLKDTAVYKKADIDRRHFSKIRSHADYRPRKQTALALALALELNLDETIDLIGRAGYALSNSSRADLIVRYCIEHGIFKLVDVNALLFQYDQPLLGGRLA